tara:strand:- start:148 stop:432 length:285 start_codon:yes stop_codon:yes gene_type:complete
MKQLLFIIITFMFVSNVYAKDYTKKDMCLWARVNIEGSFSKYRFNFSKMLIAISNNDDGYEKIYYRRAEEQKKELVQLSTIYKNLDCADIAPLE